VGVSLDRPPLPHRHAAAPLFCALLAQSTFNASEAHLRVHSGVQQSPDLMNNSLKSLINIGYRGSFILHLYFEQQGRTWSI
jgi:hypothetical protein